MSAGDRPGARAALLTACPTAEDALVVNNGAAALLLAIAALAGTDEVVLSRGELIEIGAGFRLPDLIAPTTPPAAATIGVPMSAGKSSPVCSAVLPVIGSMR